MIRVNGIIVERKQFPDGTLYLNTDGLNLCDPIIFWYYENDAELFMLICLAKKSVGHKSLIMPYIPHARMDRVKNNGDTHTLKYFAELINSLGFDEVTVLDPHSAVSEALIDNVEIVLPDHYINTALLALLQSGINDPLLFYPDEGSMKRYSGLISKPYVFGMKKRDWRSGDILGLDVVGDIESIKGRDVLIIDDICSKGGTFYHSAKKLKELGANRIYLYVTHCENTILQGEVLTSGLIERVFTTDSIFTEKHEKIEVFEL